MWRSGLSKILTRYNGQEELIGAALPTSAGADTAAGALAVSGTEREAVAEARGAGQVTAAAQGAVGAARPRALRSKATGDRGRAALVGQLARISV